MTTEDRPMADPQREAFVEKLGLLGVPPFCPYCQTVVDSVTQTSGQLAWNGPAEAPRTHLKPCGHVLDSPIASLKVMDPIGEQILAAEERGRQRGRAELEAELQRVKNERIVSVVFAHHKGAPRPFGLYRHADVSGVSGTGLVALGCEFEDGLVVLRWTSAWPTSVVFHERGIDSVKAIHGHDGRTEIVWLSEEVADLAEAEAVSEARGRAEAIADLRARHEQSDGLLLGYASAAEYLEAKGRQP